MADRLADNKGTPFNPNKELWGQGLVQIAGSCQRFSPHRCACPYGDEHQARRTSLAGVFKCILKLFLALSLRDIWKWFQWRAWGGILLYVATAMVNQPKFDTCWRKTVSMLR